MDDLRPEIQRLNKLSFDDRQIKLLELSATTRQALLEALPGEIREKWMQEELQHLQGVVAAERVEGAEGADFIPEPGVEVKIPGADKPQDRAPDVGAELIASLVKERFAAEQKAAQLQRDLDEAAAEFQRALDEAAAECDAYYQKFGPLNPED